MSQHQFTRGDYVQDIYGGPDYGDWFEQDAPGIPGMIIIRNSRGSACVDATEYKLNEDRNAVQDRLMEMCAFGD